MVKRHTKVHGLVESKFIAIIYNESKLGILDLRLLVLSCFVPYSCTETQDDRGFDSVNIRI